MGPTTYHRKNAFTLVEVMMAATIIVIGFIGMIEVIGLISNSIKHGQRETVASQIINNEMAKLRLASWTTISGLSPIATNVAIDPQFWPVWNSTMSYVANNVVTYNGAWYRCTSANTGTVPTNTSYWTTTTTGATSDIVEIGGATFSLSRSLTSPDPVTNIREVIFTVTWVVATSRTKDDGSQLTFTYRRSNVGWFGKYGLNLTYQRS
ncbi:MAG: prepilin-type N-terminal cleavage/methylation domain-containing protein [Verrucomicrobia bacterium]|nr:prepilin-type N-terminal cleavage/methylation domain-containing protein [Verrucomicrobiota bacterium]